MNYTNAPDAIEILRAEHRQVEAWFAEFQTSKSMWREQELAMLICDAIRRHAKIDIGLFYPAFLAATGDEYKCRTVLSEYRDISDLIDEIESSGPSEDSFFAKLHLLCSAFEHHILQEEKERGVFTEAVKSGMDVETLGRELQEQHGSISDAPSLHGMTLH